jgi:hypothetical protein
MLFDPRLRGMDGFSLEQRAGFGERHLIDKNNGGPTSAVARQKLNRKL